MFLLMMMLSNAMAGKLAEGFRGLPYGPASVLDTAPGESCANTGEAGVRWVCLMRLGEASVEVSYMVQEGLFCGILIRSAGYSNATAFFDVLLAGYGVGTPANTYDESRMADRRWQDGDVIGSWEYNKYSDKAQFISFNRSLMAQIKAIETERAKAAAGGL
jgi:hypothetical protein